MNFFHLVLFATIDVSLFQSSSQLAPVSIIASHLFCQILLEGPHWLCLHRRWNNPDPQPQEQITLSNSVFFSAYRRRNLPLFQERTDCCRHLPFLVNSPSQLLQFYIVQCDIVYTICIRYGHNTEHISGNWNNQIKLLFNLLFWSNNRTKFLGDHNQGTGCML